MSSDPILVSIEGDIGAGKSTLINALKERHPDWNFIDEPVGTWQGLKNEEGENLLELFYKDQNKYAYTFQNCAILSRAQNIQFAVKRWKALCELNPEEKQNNIFITERCLETDYFVFAKMMYDTGKMGLLEWDLYKMWYNFAKENSYPLKGLVYVSTPPEICAERILQRGRKGEENIPLDYLRDLEKYQKDWLYTSHNSLPILNYRNYGEHVSTIEDIEDYIESINCSERVELLR